MRYEGYCDPGVIVDWSYGPKHVADEIKSMWDIPRRHLAVHSQPTLGESNIAFRFRALAEEWSREVGIISSVSDLVSHPKYQEIISLGWDAVPLLLSDLKEKRGFWFPALSAITGIRPFDRSDAGNSKRMTEAWIAWGKKKKLI